MKVNIVFRQNNRHLYPLQVSEHHLIDRTKNGCSCDLNTILEDAVFRVESGQDDWELCEEGRRPTRRIVAV